MWSTVPRKPRKAAIEVPGEPLGAQAAAAGGAAGVGARVDAVRGGNVAAAVGEARRHYCQPPPRRLERTIAHRSCRVAHRPCS